LGKKLTDMLSGIERGVEAAPDAHDSNKSTRRGRVFLRNPESVDASQRKKNRRPKAAVFNRNTS
jgi:hypothetical protein